MFTWQLAPAPSDLPVQLSDSPKSPGFAPPRLTPFIVSAELPEFVTVTACETLLVPTLCEAYVKFGGEI